MRGPGRVSGTTKGDTRIPACGGCAGEPSRRDFVRRSAAAVAAVLAAVGVPPSAAAALPVRFRAGREADAGELTFPVPAADGALIDRRNEVIVVRCQARAFAFALSCPHQRTMLKWHESEQRFQCPKHKSKYRPDGVFISGRATRGMDRLPVRLAGGDIVLDTTAAIRQDEDEAAWNAAEIRLAAG